ncbi:GGDEF domain-containing protein [Alteromonas sediminis]|uniref:diguanylate cyclase n=1 Tax=Alteromonas sediminis TaxID=2259342 RepID=A0A3N5Y2V6_9ALTE|nr:GGDEF domain-containing protein [Alteromonas sediminis]RPJ67016.1 GGDEF domain-containing protein [Alteromonas sediminis]
MRLTLFALLTIALLALIFTAASAVYFFNQQHTLNSRFYTLKVMAQDIALHDEILTMSTLAATSHDAEKWKARYDKYEVSLDNLLEKASATDAKISQFFDDTAEANTALVRMEKRAFELIKQGNNEQALALLQSIEYQNYKIAFGSGIANAIDEVLKETQLSLDESLENRGRNLIISMVLSFILVLVLWFYLIRYVRLTEKAIEGIAKKDELSGLLNRREFNRILSHEMNRARRENKRLMLAILDLDNFKKFNDRYGHPKGDDVIKEVGTLLTRLSRRANESAFRVGGEEFVVIATCDTEGEGFEKSQSICREVSLLNIVHEDNPPYNKVTVSCGIAFSDSDNGLTALELYSRADKALYQAKGDGKNRFKIFGHDSSVVLP